MSLVQTVRPLLNSRFASNLKRYRDHLSKFICFKKSVSVNTAVSAFNNWRFVISSKFHIKSYCVNMDDSLLNEISNIKEANSSQSHITQDKITEPIEEKECIKDCVLKIKEVTAQQDPEVMDSDKNLRKGMSNRAFKRMERRKKWVEKQRLIKFESQQKSNTSADDNMGITKCTEGDITIKENEDIKIKSKNMTRKERRRQWKKDEKNEMKRKQTEQQIEELKNLPLKHTNIVTRQEEGDKVFHHREHEGLREYLVRDWSCTTGIFYLTWQPKLQLQELEHLIIEYDKNTSIDDQPDSKGEDQDAMFNNAIQHEKRKAEDDLFLDNMDTKKAKIETKKLKKKRPGFSDERYNETQYYIENGLQKVYPYYFTFTTFTKGRWVGEKILDVFAREFRAHSAEEYERCIKNGALTVNYEKVDTNYRLKNNEVLANTVHRHEVPVTAEQIPIIHLDEDLIVVDKPASIPVHPCGRYRHNTMIFILAKEYNLKNLHTIHRLDRLTSGLLLFGRSSKKTREMEHQIRTRQVAKEYVCRVEGEFPKEHIKCNEPIEIVSYKIGVCKVAPLGKDCQTEFQRLSFNGSTSVVLCRPLTGRMHQIRVHLQYLGYPIVNDPLYNHTVFGPNKGKGGILSKTDDQLIQDLIKIHNAENWLGVDGDAEYSMLKSEMDKGGEQKGGSKHNTCSKEKSSLVEDSPTNVMPPSMTSSAMILPTTTTHQETIHTNKAFNGCSSESIPAEEQIVGAIGVGSPVGDLGKNLTGAEKAQKKENTYQASLMTVDEHCYECKVCYKDPKSRDLVMYLHALKYSGPGWHFETKLPEWAAEDWKDLENL